MALTPLTNRMEKLNMITATASERPKRSRIRLALVLGFMRKHERSLIFVVPSLIAVILSAVIGLNVYAITDSVSDGLGVASVMALTALIVSMITATLASDNSEARTAQTWKRYYMSRVSEARRNSEALTAEIDSLTNLISDMTLGASWYDSEKRDLLRLNLVAWISNGGTIGTYAEAFHNGEGVGDDDCLTREHAVRRYLGQHTY